MRIVATIVVLLFAVIPDARADEATISVATDTGAVDPAAGVPRIVTVSGTASAPERIYVKYRAGGGAPCAPSSSSDPGAVLSSFYAEGVEGPFSLQDVIEWDTPGEVLFCTWLSSGDAETVTTPFAQLIAFRAPRGWIAATVRPAKSRPGKLVTVHVSGSSEVGAAVFAKVSSAGGAPCASTYRADPGRSLLDGAAANGSFAFELAATEGRAGRYRVCLWLARAAGDVSPLAGPRAVTFGVVAPPSRCVVPSVPANRRLATVRRRLRAAHCRVGRVVRAGSRTVARGAVIRLGRRSRARFAAGTPIDVVVSTGPPPAR
jgi:hypothetical protein